MIKELLCLSREFSEDVESVDCRKVLAQISDETGIRGFVKGGYVRNVLYTGIHGKPLAPKDIDIWLDHGVNIFVEHLVGRGAKIQARRPRKGTPVFETVFFLKGKEIAIDIGILIANADTYSRSTNIKSLIEQDAFYSDFTINCIYLPLGAEFDIKNLIDPTGGLADLKNKKIRMTSPFIFQSSPVCMLRAVRFADLLESDIEPYTKDAIIHFAPTLSRSLVSLITANLDAILSSRNRIANARLLRELKLDKAVPERYQAMIDQLA